MGTPELSVMAARKTHPLTALSTKLDEISSRLAALEKGQQSFRQSLDRKLASIGPVTSPKVDGPVPPESFRLGSKLYDPFTRLEYRLLACLWGKDDLEISEVLEALYGHDHKKEEDALRSVAKRLKKKLRKQSFPGVVVVRKGYAALQLWSKGKGAGMGQGRPPSDHRHQVQ
jgi:hypothetical protein